MSSSRLARPRGCRPPHTHPPKKRNRTQISQPTTEPNAKQIPNTSVHTYTEHNAQPINERNTNYRSLTAQNPLTEHMPFTTNRTRRQKHARTNISTLPKRKHPAKRTNRATDTHTDNIYTCTDSTQTHRQHTQTDRRTESTHRRIDAQTAQIARPRGAGWGDTMREWGVDCVFPQYILRSRHHIPSTEPLTVISSHALFPR